MPRNALNTPEQELIHDVVFIESIDRTEKLIRHLCARTGIKEAIMRDEQVLAEMLAQLVREENAADSEILQDACIYLDEWTGREAGAAMKPLHSPSPSPVNNSFYDRVKAKAYIDTYWKNYNPAYPSFQKGGGDCTNFVSQVLYAGGMPWGDAGKGPFNSSSWYCKPGATNRDGDKRITLSWKVSASFRAYWQTRVERHMMLSYAKAMEEMNVLAQQTHIGDVVQFCYSSGVPYHTLVITGYNLDADYPITDIALASHTRDSNTRSLYRTLMKDPPDYKLRVYWVKISE